MHTTSIRLWLVLALVCGSVGWSFQPDFFAYGIEVNFLVKNNRVWNEYVRFLKPVYMTLKREHPDLPLFVSLQIDEVWKDFDRQAAAIRQILPYTDYIAISSYPYLEHPNPSSLPEDFISRVAKLAPSKPFAVAETGFIAEELDFSTGVRIPGNEEWQAQWVARVLEQAEALDAEFVVWFVPRDYDIFFRNLVEFVKINTAAAPLVDVFRTFRDTGLLDGAGRPRPAYELWNEVRRRSRR